MSAVLPDLFKGVAVVIDNGIGQEEQVDKIIGNIKAGGGHVIERLSLPDADYDLEHFARVSFFIMDWNLVSVDGVPLEANIRMPDHLAKEMVADNIAFLRRISESRHAPVVIFTNEDPDAVREALKADADLYRRVEVNHILIRRKDDVVDKLFEVLEGWAKETPSVLTLKTWERAYHRAANGLFIDLHDRTTYWPVMMWQTFGEDGLPPDVEMGRLLNRLVEARMEPMELDLDPFVPGIEEAKAKDEAAYRESMYKVLEGERFLRADRLTDDLYAPGDFFSYKADDGNVTYWMNIRPECDCLRGSEDRLLYLLKAAPLEEAEKLIDKDFGTFTVEKDNEAIVYAMFGGITYSVRFKDMKTKTAKQIKKDMTREGRLLAPFLTRVQQRYSGYLQRPGLPRPPAALYAAG